MSYGQSTWIPLLQRMARRMLGVALALAIAGCATEPDPLDISTPEAVAKGLFAGTWHYNMTVTDAEWGNPVTFIGEQLNTYSGKPIVLRWEITETHLNGHMVPQAYRDKDGKVVNNDALHQKSLVLAFPIKSHFDIRYRYNPTTRDELPIIEDNRDRSWQERAYMKVDWSVNEATSIWSPTASDLATGAIKQEPAGYERIEFFAKAATGSASGQAAGRIDPRTWRSEADGAVETINIDTKVSFSGKLTSAYQLYYGNYLEPTTVRFRHSLLKVDQSARAAYQPLDYPDTFFRRFGYFRTQYDVYDPLTHAPVESQKKYLANRWGLSDQKKITWKLSPSFQKAVDEGDNALLQIAKDVCSAYNKALKEATGRDDDIVVLQQNSKLLDAAGQPVLSPAGEARWRYETGDLRHSMINMVFKQSLAQPLGYGPAIPHADTGEILNATVNIYAGWAEWVIQRALDQYDVAAGHCTLEDIKAGRHYDAASNACDIGPSGNVDDGPIDNQGQSVVVSDTPHAFGSGFGQRTAAQSGALYHQLLTPALKTAYFPRARLGQAVDVPRLRQSVQAALPKLQTLHRWDMTHPTQIDLKGFATIKGSPYESALVPAGNLQSLMPSANDASDPEVVAALSPARRLSAAKLSELRANTLHGMVLRDEPTMFEPAINAFVQEMKDKPRNEVVRTLRHWVYYTTMLHEMGHTMGLRHNFAASADRRNYAPKFEAAYAKYWDNVEQLRRQYTPAIDAGDANAYENYVRAVDALPSVHDRYASASIMDYVGDWTDWTEELRSYDRAALLFAYGQKVEVKEGAGWVTKRYTPGDFEQDNLFDPKAVAASGRQVRTYLFCSDEKVYDDAFCTPFDRGSTATEIVRNFIKSSQTSYVFSNFKRDRSSFDGSRSSYYFNKWLRQYYMYAKPFTQITVNSSRYPEFWSSLFSGLGALAQGPESRSMKPGYMQDGGEDLLRAAMLYYYFLLYDVLMRPDYGYYQLQRDTKGALHWNPTQQRFLDDQKMSVFVPAGVGWGFADRWDVQQDSQRYYELLKRIGVELDKVIALELLSIPAVLNSPLLYEKANGVSFWNSLWTDNGRQLWEVVRGIITGNFSHQQNPWCMRCDAACQANPESHPPQLEVHPVGYLEGLARGGLITNYPLPKGENRCGPDAYPIKPGMDDLFAIKPIFYAIAGASHPWYSNGYADRLDSQIKGGNHRFDMPQGAEVAEFVNSSGTKTYQAVQTQDGLSISYALVDNGRRIANRIALVSACLNGGRTDGLFETPGTFGRSCEEVRSCYDPRETVPPYCEAEGWSATLQLESLKYRDLDRIEAMLIMMQDMVDLAGHYAWRVPGYLSE